MPLLTELLFTGDGFTIMIALLTELSAAPLGPWVSGQESRIAERQKTGKIKVAVKVGRFRRTKFG